MQRWEALEDISIESLRKQCSKGTTTIVRVLRIFQTLYLEFYIKALLSNLLDFIPETPCYANLEYTRSEPLVILKQGEI
jgi:hypothetical protein